MTLWFSFLMVGVVFVNGFTDASSAVATCISTRSLSPHGALLLAATCNLIGTAWSACTQRELDHTIYALTDFGNNAQAEYVALCAALLSFAVWAVFTWRFGLPVGASHALLAAFGGASVACHGSFAGLQFVRWSNILAGFFLSTLPALLLSRLLLLLIQRICHTFDRRRMIRTFRRAQILSAGSSALLHGVQNSQKFMSICMLGLSFAEKSQTGKALHLPLWITLLCGGVMALGTLMGGGRIIRTIGMHLIHPNATEGTAADMAASALLTSCSLCGIPVSPVHVKLCAMMGVGPLCRHGIHSRVAGHLLLVWLLTFPVCALMGYFLALLILL